MTEDSGAIAEPQQNIDAVANTARELTLIRRSLLGILFLLLTIAAYFAKDVILPIILGVLIALTLSPVVRGLARLNIPPPLTALALILTMGGIVGGGAYVASGPVTGWIEDAPRLGAEVRTKLRELSTSVEAVQEASEQVEQIAEDNSDPTVQRVAIETPGFLSAAMTNAATVLTTAAITLVLSFFLLASGDLFYIKLIESFPKFGDKKRALQIVYGIEGSVSRYLLTVTLINAGLGLSIAVLLSLIGMPQPIVWGIVAFLFNFLPYIGALVGTALVAAVAIITFDSLPYALLAPLIYLTCTSIEGQIVTPVILGRRLELNTVSVFVTVVFWAWLWGVAGALMAVPFLVCVKVVCDRVEGLQTLGNFLAAAEGRARLDPLRDAPVDGA
ncbi:AI-2E family transporter [Aliiroseovarius sp. YM-037]|uniref:AI-2E family transporter n=1 Tax=Aliiroseovarius sp. YM-037 TaxID=3341728 RepID=UPI003A7F8782